MFATWRLGVVGCVASALTGCVYIGGDLLTNKINCLDEDGDGVSDTPREGSDLTFQCPGVARDCDDHDPDRFPGNPEVAYDRVDQDCDGANLDLVDVDEDGFPGIGRADWEQLANANGDNADWPPGVVDGNTKVGKEANFDCDDDPTGDDATDAVPDAVDVNPSKTEAFGDGIDQDCSCLDAKGVCDDFDSDGDGYVPDIYKDDSDLPAGDCDDTAPDVNPGVDFDDDAPYDGVDSNCDGLNDFDIDGDGYMPNAFGSTKQADWEEMFFQFCRAYGWAPAKAGSDPDEYVECYEELYDIAKAPEWGDCADSDDELPSGSPVTSDQVFPGADDDWYDGVDANCNRDNDFDQDGDLYIDDVNADDYAAYMAFWDLKESDCHEVTAHRLSCTDGVDNNKDGAIDDDDPLCQDPANLGVEGDISYGVCGGSDCDDADETVHPNDAQDDRPGVMESLGDSTDQDCEGGKDTTTWQYGGFGWQTPRNIVVGRNDRHWLLSTGATDTDAAPYKNAGLALLFDPDAAADDDPVDQTTWFVPQTSSTVQTIGGRTDMVTVGDGFYAALSYTHEPICSPTPCTPPPPSTYSVVKYIYWDTGINDYRNRIAYRQISTVKDTYPDVDLRLDGNGYLWTFGCGAQTLAYVVADPNSTPTPFAYKSKGCYGAGNCDVGSINPVNPTQCFLDVPAAPATLGKGTVCNSSACTTYDLDGGNATGAVTLSSTQPYSTLTTGYTGVDWQNGYRTIIPPTGTGFSLVKDGTAAVTVLTSFQVRAAAASATGGTLYIAAIVSDQNADGREDVLVAYGPATGTTFTTAFVPLEIDDGVSTFTFDPDEISVYADGERVMLGVSGKKVGSQCLSSSGVLCDIVAWAFLGPQG